MTVVAVASNGSVVRRGLVATLGATSVRGHAGLESTLERAAFERLSVSRRASVCDVASNSSCDSRIGLGARCRWVAPSNVQVSHRSVELRSANGRLYTSAHEGRPMYMASLVDSVQRADIDACLNPVRVACSVEERAA